MASGFVPPLAHRHRHRTTQRMFLPVALLLGLIGCGSGGSGDLATPEDATPPGVEEDTLRLSISGTVQPQALNRVDSDVNDVATPAIRNNRFDQAQAMTAPAIVGGYVVTPGTIASRNSRFGVLGDEWDVYQVDLREQQVILLEIADPSEQIGATLDLYLYDPLGRLVDVALGGRLYSKSLVVATTGTHFIGVRAVRGGSNYVLRIGLNEETTRLGLRAPRVSDAFVPGEFIVQTRAPTHLPLHTTEDLTDAWVARNHGQATAHGLEAIAGGPGRAQLWRSPARHGILQPRDADANPQPYPKATWVMHTPPATQSPPKGIARPVPDPGTPEPALPELPRPRDSSTRFLDPDGLPMRFLDAGQEARFRTLVQWAALEEDPDIAAVDLNGIRQIQRVPADPLHPLQWYQAAVRLPDAWEITTGAEPLRGEVTVAVVDTGVFLQHEDLREKWLPGFDFIRDPQIANDGDGIDPNPDDPGDSPILGRSSWHGTHVAGIVGAMAENGLGIAGTSWGVRILPLRALGIGGGTAYDTLQAVRYAAGLPNDSGRVPDQPAQIINLSLGGAVYSTQEEQLFRELRQLGIFVVAAAGNTAGAVLYPAAYDSVIAVGATDARNQRAYYSNVGPALDLMAPGGDKRSDFNLDGFPDGILSTTVDDRSGVRRSSYDFGEGTSMAAPIVSGILALALSLDSRFSPDQFLEALRSGILTQDLGLPGWDPDTGWGLIDAARLLQTLQEGDAGTPLLRLTAQPALLDFSLVESRLNFTLTATDPAQIRSVTLSTTADWLSVAPGNVLLNGLGTYIASVARDRLTLGEYQAEILVQSDTGVRLTIPVRVRVRPADIVEDQVGRIYVLLLDRFGETLEERALDTTLGSVGFTFSDLPPGRYRIVAGSDMNADGFICDFGEACGAYPTLSLYEQIDLEQDLPGLTFSVGFRSILGLDPQSTDVRPTALPQ
jgi:serine protease